MKHSLAILMMIVAVALIGCGKAEEQLMLSGDMGAVRLLAPPAKAPGEILKVWLDSTTYSKSVALTSQSQALTMSGIVKGDYTLKAAIYDAANVETENGSVPVKVLPGKIVQAEIQLGFNTGSLDINVKRATDELPKKVVVIGMPDTYSPYNNVTVRLQKASDYTVALSSYQTINWKLELTGGGQVSKVIVSQMGTEYSASTLTGHGNATVHRTSTMGWAYMFRSASQNDIFFTNLRNYLGVPHDGFFGPNTYIYSSMIYVDVNM